MSRVISYSTSPSSVPGNGSSEEANVRTYRMPMACSTARDAVFTDIVCAITRSCPRVAKACRSRARDASLARPCHQYRRTRR